MWLCNGVAVQWCGRDGVPEVQGKDLYSESSEK